MPLDDALPQLEIYTDGGCDPNPGAGGWGAVLISGLHTKEISGADPATTNNRMELTAAISALRTLKRPCEITLYTDSQYLRKGMTKWLPGWQANDWRRGNGRPVENKDLWQELLRETKKHRVEWCWVRGHRGNPLNERADRLATEARRDLLAQGITGRGVNARQGREDPSEALPHIELYTRGCSLGTPGPGGYAAVALHDSGPAEVVSGAWPLTTNNVMELWAVVAGLRSLERRSGVTVHTTSKYTLDGATRWLSAWERRDWLTKDGHPVKNKEIWQELSHVMGDHDVTWEFLPRHKRGSHSGQAARVARDEAKRMKRNRS